MSETTTEAMRETTTGASVSGQEHGFDANRILVVLFVLTAVEVAWGAFVPYDIKWALWGGLLIFAFWKGFLIFMYFMHMKFEGYLCKCLIAPTIPLVLIIFFALVPDIAANRRLNHDIADQLDPVDGSIAEIGTGSRNKSHVAHEEDEHDEEDTGDGGN